MVIVLYGRLGEVTYRNKLTILFSLLLFLLMASFPISSYAVPCHDSGESNVEYDSKHKNTSANNPDNNEFNESGIIQKDNCCQNCIGMGTCCSSCKKHHQSLSVLVVKDSKNYLNFRRYKNINDSFQLLPINNLIVYKDTYKFNRLYSSSLFSPSQSTHKHRVLLI